jgi:L,D-transpeptidase YcbB
MKVLRSIIALCFLILAGCGSKENPADAAQVVVEDPEKVNTLVTEYLKDQVSKTDTSAPLRIGRDSLVSSPYISGFYAGRGYKPAWSDKGRLNANGDSLFRIIRDAESFGLIPQDYHRQAIDSMLRTAYDSAHDSYNINKLAFTDLMLTDAFFSFAVHVSVGRMANDSAAVREWRAHVLDTNLVALLNTALKTNRIRRMFESLEPQRIEYQAVKQYLNKYRAQYGTMSWEHLPDRKADSLAFFAAIHNRLVTFGDIDTSTTERDSLVPIAALKKFQARYFLEPDGKMGRNTLLALDMTPQDWTRQIAANMERWRWEPEHFEKQHMIVNLPAFKMTVWENDTIVMESRIVCGAVKTQTPELDSKMYQIVLYPYWNVPYSIAWKEILPHVKRDSTYLRKNRYEVLDRDNQLVDPNTVNWKKYGKGNLPYKFRQMTGDDNALGIMKFEFHNKWSVYMHDTNSKRYFRYETRAFSHGCMRLENYMQLAHFLIRDDSVKLPRDTFDMLTRQGNQRKINLRKPLPIHVRYFTCQVDPEGNVELRTDIYLRDKQMINVLYGIKEKVVTSKPKVQAKPIKSTGSVSKTKKQVSGSPAVIPSLKPESRTLFIPRRYQYADVC